MTDVLACVMEILQIVFLAGGLLVAVFLFLQLAPRVRLGISARWPCPDSPVCILTLTVSNESRVRIRTKEALLQVTLHPAAEIADLTEWVEFSKATPIWTSSRYLYPGETVSVERPLLLSDLSTIAHVGIKYRALLSPFGKLVSLLREPQVDWTTTVFIVHAQTRMPSEGNTQSGRPTGQAGAPDPAP